DKGIPTAVHYPKPLHLQPVYEGQFSKLKFPVSEAICQKVISLPMHPYLGQQDIQKIVSAV
ncbi:MAG: DegT/DnrJ/EryC1/StrS family aminotransferase, partial [Bdellovibrionota bacterium]